MIQVIVYSVLKKLLADFSVRAVVMNVLKMTVKKEKMENVTVTPV